ncbi:MAG: hypothetical protein ACYDDN_04455, partial [Candidatus Desulforudaceae bacterium]
MTKVKAHGQEKVHNQKDQAHMAVPTRIRADFVMVHAEVAFVFLEQLLNGPAHPGDPDHFLHRNVFRRIAEGVFHGSVRILPQKQPAFFSGPAVSLLYYPDTGHP